MTHNQIMKSQLREEGRHNREMEDIERGKLSENIRSNKSRENISTGELSERTRHNKADEYNQSKRTSNDWYLGNRKQDSVDYDIWQKGKIAKDQLEDKRQERQYKYYELGQKQAQHEDKIAVEREKNSDNRTFSAGKTVFEAARTILPFLAYMA